MDSFLPEGYDSNLLARSKAEDTEESIQQLIDVYVKNGRAVPGWLRAKAALFDMTDYTPADEGMHWSDQAVIR